MYHCRNVALHVLHIAEADVRRVGVARVGSVEEAVHRIDDTLAKEHPEEDHGLIIMQRGGQAASRSCGIRLGRLVGMYAGVVVVETCGVAWW